MEVGVVPMSQITLYLDPTTHAIVERAAQANGLSKSRWVAEVIRKYAANEWPKECISLAGSFADFPLVEPDSTPISNDLPRISF